MRRPGLLKFGSRNLSDFEWHFLYGFDTPDLEIYFYVKRGPIRLNLFFPQQTGITVKSVQYGLDSDPTPIEYAVEVIEHEEGQEILVSPVRIRDAKKIVLTLDGLSPPFQGPNVIIQVPGGVPKDVDLLQFAADHVERISFLDPVIADLKEYETYSTQNPSACFWLGEAYRQKERFDQAEEYALQSLAILPSDRPAQLYARIQNDKPRIPIEGIRQLQKEALQWVVDRHHGLMVLEQQQNFRLGLNGWHLQKRRDVIEVKRKAAGRFLRGLGFPLSDSESLLFTTLRIIKKDGEIEEVRDENFTLGESEDNNTLITVENEQKGTWILPDLLPGDVIDWEHHIFCRDHSYDGDPEFFILTSAFDATHPTFRSQVDFVIPENLPVELISRNGELAERRAKSDPGGLERVTFSGSRFVPSKNTNYEHENYLLNPVLACSPRNTSWADVSRKGRIANFGDDEGETQLPEPLLQMVEGANSAQDALERAFYWVRDQLKYASLRSGLEHIGKSARAERIVESGIGDCKDKSYLLSLVCRRFDIPFEYVAVSTKRGVLIQEVPAQQFDHVFLRAQTGDDWSYLDAANPMATFGSPPGWCQGLKGLILDTEGSIIDIPVDAPEANLLEITEVFDEAVEGWMRGTFDFRARGQSGRIASEYLKGASLHIGDSSQAVQQGIGPYLPFIVVFEHARVSDTGSSNLLHTKGRHARAPLASLGKTQKQVGRLSWGMPPLPIGYWRNLQMDRLFVMDFPLQINLQVVIEGELFKKLDDVSHITDLENRVCRITETTTRNPEDITIQRDLVFKERFVQGDLLGLVPPAMEAFERSLHLVLSFDK